MDALLAWLNDERGRRSKLAAHLKMYPGALSQWDRVPAERVIDVEKFTGIKREKLRPDLYRKASAA